MDVGVGVTKGVELGLKFGFVMEVAQVGVVFKLGFQVGVVKLGCSSMVVQVGVL
jgi:hypothetical protein